MIRLGSVISPLCLHLWSVFKVFFHDIDKHYLLVARFEFEKQVFPAFLNSR